jgi:hypothetical protein
MRSLVVVLPIHHNNTVRVANVLARVLNAQIKKPHRSILRSLRRTIC